MPLQKPSGGRVSWRRSWATSPPRPPRSASSGHSIARVREWYMEQVESGEVVAINARLAAGETPHEILADTPAAPQFEEGVRRYERAIELFEQVGDRRGVMSAIIARAYVAFGLDIHLLGAAGRIEEIRRLAAQMTSLTRESERAAVEAQMLYGVQVFARAKVVPDLALAGRGGSQAGTSAGRPVARVRRGRGPRPDAPRAGGGRAGGAVARPCRGGSGHRPDSPPLPPAR